MRRSVRVCRPKFHPLLRAECGKVLPAVPRSFFFLSFMSLVGLSGRNRLPGISCSSSPDLVSDTRHDWNAGSTLSATALPDAVDAPRRNILFIRRERARQIQNLTVAVVPVRTLPPPLPVGRDSTNRDALSLTRRGGFPGNEVRGLGSVAAAPSAEGGAAPIFTVHSSIHTHRLASSLNCTRGHSGGTPGTAQRRSNFPAPSRSSLMAELALLLYLVRAGAESSFI